MTCSWANNSQRNIADCKSSRHLAIKCFSFQTSHTSLVKTMGLYSVLSLFALVGALFASHLHAFECPVNVIERPSSQATYRVGVLAIRGVETAFDEFHATTEYLTKTAGAMFDPPINFETVPVSFTGDVIDKFVSGTYDFIYLQPSLFSCVSSEIGAHSLATKISRRVVGGEVYKLTKFGGVILTQADNDEINTIQDIKDKRIALISLTGLGRYVHVSWRIKALCQVSLTQATLLFTVVKCNFESFNVLVFTICRIPSSSSSWDLRSRR